MNEKRIRNLIQNDESEILEFKESTGEWKEIIKTISAFANTRGGTVVVGISDTGDILGIQIGRKTIEDLTNKIKENTDPKVFPSISVKNIDGDSIIIITIEESLSKPLFGFDRVYKRVGKSTLRASSEEIRKMALSERKVYWDGMFCEEATLKDIDEERVKWFLKKAKAERNLDIDPSVSSEEALKKLNLINDGKLTNTAILMFGKNPQRTFIQSKVRCARFKGTKPLDFIDMKVFDGTVPELREKAMKFVIEHTRHAVYFDANRRYDRWEYPLRAIEEAITNALAHRDYFSNGEIQLSIFDDRIGIWNPGELPEPLTPDDLKREHKSIPRNKLIANLLFLIKYIERWGTGTNRIIDEMKAHNLPEADFFNTSGGFEVTLIGPGKTFELETEREKLHILAINERQKAAIEYLKNNEIIHKRKYMELNKVSDKTAYIELTDLVKKEILVKQGKGRAVSYKLKK